jgi:hypothetical protein
LRGKISFAILREIDYIKSTELIDIWQEKTYPDENHTLIQDR